MQESNTTNRAGEIAHPSCSLCGSPMWLTRIEHFGADHDERAFECRACGRTEIETVKFG